MAPHHPAAHTPDDQPAGRRLPPPDVSAQETPPHPATVTRYANGILINQLFYDYSTPEGMEVRDMLANGELYSDVLGPSPPSHTRETTIHIEEHPFEFYSRAPITIYSDTVCHAVPFKRLRSLRTLQGSATSESLRTEHTSRCGAKHNITDTSREAGPARHRLVFSLESAIVKLPESLVLDTNAPASANPENEREDTRAGESQQPMRTLLLISSAVNTTRLEVVGAMTLREVCAFFQPLSKRPIGLAFRGELIDENASVGDYQRCLIELVYI